MKLGTNTPTPWPNLQLASACQHKRLETTAGDHGTMKPHTTTTTKTYLAASGFSTKPRAAVSFGAFRFSAPPPPSTSADGADGAAHARIGGRGHEAGWSRMERMEAGGRRLARRRRETAASALAYVLCANFFFTKTQQKPRPFISRCRCGRQVTRPGQSAAHTIAALY